MQDLSNDLKLFSIRYLFVWMLAMGLAVNGWALSAAVAQLKVKMMLSAVELPPGFKIRVYADQVPGARSMALSPSGVLFVGTREAGRVYAVIDRNHDMQADRIVTVAQGLDMPNGVALQDGDLYVAEVHRILRYPQIESRLAERLTPEVVYDAFPRDRQHGWKFIRFGPG